MTSQKPAEKETIGICGYQPSTRNNLRIVSDFTSLKNFTFFKSSLSTKGQLVYKNHSNFPGRLQSRYLVGHATLLPRKSRSASSQKGDITGGWGEDKTLVLIGIQENLWLHMLRNIFANRH